MKFRQGGPDCHYSIPVALLVDLLGGRAQAQEFKVLTDQPLSMAQLRAMLREQWPWPSRHSGTVSS